MHTEIQSLLPWYVTGALGEAEQQALTAHLARCQDCATACEAERALVTRLAARNESLPDAPAALARLEGRTDFERPATNHRTRGRLARLFAATPPGMRRLALAQAAAIAVLAIALGVALGLTPLAPRYHTVSDPRPVTAGASFDVVFAADAPQSAMRGLLSSSASQVIAGPNAAGAYTVQTQADPATAQAVFRASPAVIFVGSVAPARE